MATEEGVHAVTEAFVEQYYHIVGKLTHEAHRLYVDASVVSRPGPDGTMVSFTSLESINKHFHSCDYEGTTFDVLSFDSQSSLDDGIFIMVIGFLTGKDNLKRKFSQMFYLARQDQPGQDNAYVVVNDIYRFVDEESSTPTTLPAVETVPETEVVKPVVEINKTEPVKKIDAPAEKSVDAAEVQKVVAGATPPLYNGNNKHSAEKAVTAQKPKEEVAETAAAAPLDGAKKSYAAMVLSMSRNAAPFQAKAAAVQKPKSMAQPKPRAATTSKSPAAVGKTEKKNERMVDEPGTSIFVANLPMDAMPPQLHELFKDFGPIKEDGVQIRSSRSSGRCFGFVAFDSVASVQSVLKAAKSNSFKLGEHKLRVKEKQVDYDGSKPSGGRSGGGSKTQNGSADESRAQTGSADGSKTENGSADENKTQNGSADGEDDDFKPIKSRRNRSERRGDRTGNGDKINQRNSERGAPRVRA